MLDDQGKVVLPRGDFIHDGLQAGGDIQVATDHGGLDRFQLAGVVIEDEAPVLRVAQEIGGDPIQEGAQGSRIDTHLVARSHQRH